MELGTALSNVGYHEITAIIGVFISLSVIGVAILVDELAGEVADDDRETTLYYPGYLVAAVVTTFSLIPFFTIEFSEYSLWVVLSSVCLVSTLTVVIGTIPAVMLSMFYHKIVMLAPRFFASLLGAPSTAKKILYKGGNMLVSEARTVPSRVFKTMKAVWRDFNLLLNADTEELKEGLQEVGGEED